MARCQKVTQPHFKLSLHIPSWTSKAIWGLHLKDLCDPRSWRRCRGCLRVPHAVQKLIHLALDVPVLGLLLQQLGALIEEIVEELMRILQPSLALGLIDSHIHRIRVLTRTCSRFQMRVERGLSRMSNLTTSLTAWPRLDFYMSMLGELKTDKFACQNTSYSLLSVLPLPWEIKQTDRPAKTHGSAESSARPSLFFSPPLWHAIPDACSSWTAHYLFLGAAQISAGGSRLSVSSGCRSACNQTNVSTLLCPYLPQWWVPKQIPMSCHTLQVLAIQNLKMWLQFRPHSFGHSKKWLPAGTDLLDMWVGCLLQREIVRLHKTELVPGTACRSTETAERCSHSRYSQSFLDQNIVLPQEAQPARRITRDL